MNKNAGLRELLGSAKRTVGRRLAQKDEQIRQMQSLDPRIPLPEPGRIAGLLLQRALKKGETKLPGSLGRLMRRARVNLRMAQHEARVDPKTLPEETRKLVEESNARVFERGRRSVLGKILGPTVSKYYPHLNKVVVGGGVKTFPNITKHELGHASGIMHEHPGAMLTVRNLTSRRIMPAAVLLARAGLKTPAQIVHGLGQAATLGEEARAWARGIGPDIKKRIKEKGALRGIFSKETAKQLPAPIGGLGSYIASAAIQHRKLGRIAEAAKKRRSGTLEKKGQDMDPDTGLPAGIPPEYIEQMQAQFGMPPQQPSMLAQFAMPAVLIGGGLGIGAAASQYPRIFPRGFRAGVGNLKDKLINLFKSGNEGYFIYGFADELTKIAKKKHKMPHFTEQDRPEGVKKIYRALAHRSEKAEEMRRRYGKNWKEVAARIAARQGKPGKQHRGPPFKAPLATKE